MPSLSQGLSSTVPLFLLPELAHLARVGQCGGVWKSPDPSHSGGQCVIPIGRLIPWSNYYWLAQFFVFTRHHCKVHQLVNMVTNSLYTVSQYTVYAISGICLNDKRHFVYPLI